MSPHLISPFLAFTAWHAIFVVLLTVYRNHHPCQSDPLQPVCAPAVVPAPPPTFSMENGADEASLASHSRGSVGFNFKILAARLPDDFPSFLDCDVVVGCGRGRQQCTLKSGASVAMCDALNAFYSRLRAAIMLTKSQS